MTALRNLLSRYRQRRAFDLRKRHAQAAEHAKSAKRGKIVARHQAHALFHERLRRGV